MPELLTTDGCSKHNSLKDKKLAAGKNEKHKKQKNIEDFSTHIKLPLPGVS